jgi:hypothetical protein
MKMSIPVGLTKDAGWQMGVRRSFPIDINEAWAFLFSEEGSGLWLGKVKELKWEKGQEYKTNNGIQGVVRVVSVFSHVRITWKKKEWENYSSLQVRTIRGKNKTTIAFHQDRLTGTEQREEMLIHWEKVLNRLEKKLTQKAVL